MNRYPDKNWVDRLNKIGGNRTAAFLLVDFEQEEVRIWDEQELAATDQFYFSFQGLEPDSPRGYSYPGDLLCGSRFVSEKKYREAFDIVRQGLQRGDSFLTNLTMPTEVELSATLQDIYRLSSARYRIFYRNRFVCFSPETFIRVDRDGIISSNPMKGTAEDSEAGREYLLNSRKEIAEHATIVDLIRNDLSQVAKRVRVSKYRYLEQINTPRGGLLQTSSRIEGQLPANWRSELGTIIARLLPAGSVSGAPKPATLDLIRTAEGRSRGYYCGVGLYFDGDQLDSCVLIRFIEQADNGKFYFWAGGGITAQSNWQDEYAELVAKVRIPLFEARQSK